MKTLLTGMPWKPSDDTDITDTWRKHGWKPTSELAEGIGDIRDDYQLVQDTDWLTDIGAFKS